MGHLNGIFAPRGGNLNKSIFKSSNARGVALGGLLNYRIDQRIMPKRTSSQFFCPHCNEYLGKSMFYKDKRRYFNLPAGKWRVEEGATTKRNTETSSFVYHNVLFDVFDDDFLEPNTTKDRGKSAKLEMFITTADLHLRLWYLCTLLHEIFATRSFRDFEVRIFRDFAKFCVLNHFNFAFLVRTQFFSLEMLFNMSLN